MLACVGHGGSREECPHLRVLCRKRCTHAPPIRPHTTHTCAHTRHTHTHGTQTAEDFLRKQPVTPAEAMAPLPGAKCYITFRPLGPVLIIMPWNFPLWQAPYTHTRHPRAARESMTVVVSRSTGKPPLLSRPATPCYSRHAAKQLKPRAPQKQSLSMLPFPIQ